MNEKAIFLHKHYTPQTQFFSNHSTHFQTQSYNLNLLLQIITPTHFPIGIVAPFLAPLPLPPNNNNTRERPLYLPETSKISLSTFLLLVPLVKGSLKEVSKTEHNAFLNKSHPLPLSPLGITKVLVLWIVANSDTLINTPLLLKQISKRWVLVFPLNF